MKRKIIQIIPVGSGQASFNYKFQDESGREFIDSDATKEELLNFSTTAQSYQKSYAEEAIESFFSKAYFG